MQHERTPERPVSSASLSTLTMAELIRLIEADEALSQNRRRNLASSVRRICALLGFDTATTPASLDALRGPLKVFSPEAAGVTKKRFQTIKSDVRAAISRYARNQGIKRVALSNAWAELKARIDDFGSELRLSGLITWANAQGLPPGEIDDPAIERFRVFLETQTYKASPQRHLRQTVLHWSKLVPSCLDLGLQYLTLPEGRSTYAASLADFTPQFRGELDDWLRSLSADADLFDDRAPVKPLSTTSIDTYHFTVRQCAGALRKKGVDSSQLNRLQDLVERNHVRFIVAFFQARSSKPGKVTDTNVLHVLRLIARWTRPDDSELHQTLKMVSGRMSPGPRTMGKRPAAALRQFDDAVSFDRLVALPTQIFQALRRKKTLSMEHALEFQSALALELLLMRPIRRANLVALRLGHTLHRTGDRFRVVIPGDAVKNEEPLDYTLPAETLETLVYYIDHVLPILRPDHQGVLFPGSRSGTPKAASNLGKQLTKFVRTYTNLYVTPHLMRQICMHFYLTAVPGGLEDARQILSHRSMETTVRSYVGLRNEAALKRYDDLLLARRHDRLGT